MNLFNLKKDQNRFSKYGHLGNGLNGIHNHKQDIVLKEPQDADKFYSQKHEESGKGTLNNLIFS